MHRGDEIFVLWAFRSSFLHICSHPCIAQMTGIKWVNGCGKGDQKTHRTKNYSPRCMGTHFDGFCAKLANMATSISIVFLPNFLCIGNQSNSHQNTGINNIAKMTGARVGDFHVKSSFLSLKWLKKTVKKMPIFIGFDTQTCQFWPRFDPPPLLNKKQPKKWSPTRNQKKQLCAEPKTKSLCALADHPLMVACKQATKLRASHRGSSKNKRPRFP